MTWTTARQGIAAELQADLRAQAAALGLAANFTIKPGKLDPPQEREVGCLWSPSRVEDADNALEEILEFRCRVFLRASRGRRGEKSATEDPADLEKIVEAIYASLDDKQSANFGLWFLRCIGAEVYPDERWLEVAISAKQSNLFSA